jgi:hypothetical protein
MTSGGQSVPSDSTTDTQSAGVTAGGDTAVEESTAPDGESRDGAGGSAFARMDTWVPEEQCDLPSDVVFDILKNQRCRLVLQYLREADDPAKLGTLAEHIAAFENGVAPTGLNAQQRKRVYIGLYQCHLPKMADAGVVDFDQDRGTVAINGSGEALLAFLDADGDTTPSPRPYLLLIVAGGVLFAVSRLLLPLWTSDVVVLGLLTAVAVLAVARPSSE